MRRTVALGGLLVALTAPTHVQPAFDRTQVEREAMAVLDSLIIALNRHDAQAEERTYQFPHYRLANGTMSMWAAPGTEVRGWMNGTYQNLRASGWDHSAWTRRRFINISDSKVHIDTEFARYRKDGSLIAKFESLYIVTKEKGRWHQDAL